MHKKSTMTFKEIDQAATDLQKMTESKIKLGIQTSYSDTMTKIWEILTPVLEVLSVFWLVPAKWKRIIKIILEVKASVGNGFAVQEA